MIFWNTSWEALIVTSASSAPSTTCTVPSSTLTVHFPAPSMSKAYELFMPSVLDMSASEGSVSKNSCTVPGIYRSFSGSRASLCRGAQQTPLPSRTVTKVEIALPGQAGADALALLVTQPLGGDGAKIV